MGAFTRRSLLIGTAAAAGALGTRYLYSTAAPTGVKFPADGTAAGTGDTVLNDASELSPTRVAKHITVTQRPDENLITQLRAELKEAAAQGRGLTASAARHSMGGHSLARSGHTVTMRQQWIEPNTAAKTYRVAAGARWNTVIRDLDRAGFSPKVMQSNNDFGVASTFCVNAHGWPVPFTAFGGTVQSFRLMLADGEIVECSRTQNAELFNATMGGYGLTGIIIDLVVDMVPNARLNPKYELMPAEKFGERFVAALKGDPKIQMAYGRLNIAVDKFFDEALLITYTPPPDQSDLPPAPGSGFLSRASREVFRRQVGSDRIKNLRWMVETGIGARLGDKDVTRNALINEPVVTLEDRDPSRTDILHEYFVSPAQFPAFVKACQDVIPSSYQELLNITLRYVDTDSESLLSYAAEPRIAAVMLFSQEKSQRAEDDMRRMTRALIDRVHAIGGAYYLPYRPHATQEQFLKGYPRAGAFVAKKREIDPGLIFRNGFWDDYLSKV